MVRDPDRDPDLDLDLWLDLFREPTSIRQLGLLYLYACRDAASDARRVVLVAAPAADPVEAARVLDALAQAHRVLDHPGIPRVAARDRAGDIEYLAFDCAAVTDLETVYQRLEQRPPGAMSYACYIALGLWLGEVLTRAHATPDPEHGGPICLGRIAPSNVLIGEDGRCWVVGFGRPRSSPVWPTARDEMVAPEVAAGAAPVPVSDGFVVARMLNRPSLAVAPPALLQTILSQPRGPRELEFIDLVMRAKTALQAPLPEQRPGSVEETLELCRPIWRHLDVEPDPEGLKRLLARTVAELRAERTRTAEASRGSPAPVGPVCLRGRYQLEAPLGRGGMGSVFRAWDRQLRQQVTVKRLHDPSSPQQRERFIREVRILRQVQHPNLVRGFDLIDEGGELYAVMELVEGEPLADHLATHPEARGELPRQLSRVADGLDWLHGMAIVHRDVKPTNIIVHRDRGPVLVDFGVALESGSELTQTGARVGTPRFMSPEQQRGEPVGPKSDVYSLALVLLAGLGGEPEGALGALLARCLDEDPERRPSAGELARELRSE